MNKKERKHEGKVMKGRKIEKDGRKDESLRRMIGGAGK